jgi:integrase
MSEQSTSSAKKNRGKARIRGLSLFPVKINSVDSWRVVCPTVNGQRQIKTFRDEKEARVFYEFQYNQLRNAGVAGFSLDERQRVDAHTALEILSPFGVTLEEAAQYYAQSHEAVTESQTVWAAIQKLLAAKKADRMSARYLKDLRNRLDRFGACFGERKIASLSGAEIADWLRDLSLAPLTRNTFYLRLSALFSFAVEQRWVSENPLSRSMRAKVVGSEPGILSPEQFSGLLSNASFETLPYWAIGGFAGLRSAELSRLEWSDIDFEGGLIEITPRKSKTASRRHVTIQPALKAWFEPYRDQSNGLICPLNLRVKLEADRERAGITEWPSNALRHSFASYHLAHFKNSAELAHEMGHSDSELVFQHYRQRVKPAVAKLWWSILPASPNNLVRLSA